MGFSLKGWVTGRMITVGVVVALISAGAYVFRKYNLGANLVNSLKGVGTYSAKAITEPFTSFVSTLTQGASDLGEQAKILSEGFQKSVSQTLGGGWNVFTDFGKSITDPLPPAAGEMSTDYAKKLADTQKTNATNAVNDTQPWNNPKAPQNNGTNIDYAAQFAALKPTVISKLDAQSRALEQAERAKKNNAPIITQTNLPDSTKHFYVGLVG